MNYEPNTQAQPYTTLGEQVDWYASKGKAMVIRESTAKRVVVKSIYYVGTENKPTIIYLDASLKQRGWDPVTVDAVVMDNILGFIALTDEVDM